MPARRENLIEHVARVRRHRGVTLIELAVVMVILGLVSTSALLGVRLPLRRAELRLAAIDIVALDQIARSRARAGEPCILHFNVQRRTMLLLGQEGKLIRSVELSDQVTLASVANAEGSSIADVAFGEIGASLDYSVVVTSSTGRKKQAVFCGLSGQSYVFDLPEEE